MRRINGVKDLESWLARTGVVNAVPAGISLCFLVVGWLTVGDYGQTWDENELLNAVHSAPTNLARALRGEPVRWSTAELPAHGIALDLLRSVALSVFASDGTFTHEIRVLHAFHATLAALGLFLLAKLVLQIEGDARVASFASASLALTPQFIAHSQNNPKDLSALFVFVWSVQALVQVAERRRARDVALAACVVGLALSTRVTSALAIPVAVGWAARTGALGMPRTRVTLFLALVGAGFMTLLFWPWLWRDTLGNLLWSARHVTHFWYDAPVQYLGRRYTSQTTPWHYFLVNLAAFTPVPMLALAGVGFFAGLRKREWRSLFSLSVIWFAVVWLSDFVSSSHYDGVRHQLAILPSIAILVALGVFAILENAGRWFGVPRAGAMITGGAALWVLAWDVYFHPYQGAYVNGVAKLASGGATQEFFPLEYWGASYQEGSRWLLHHAEPGARLFVPVAPHLVARYIDRPIEERIPPGLPRTGMYYVMYIMRVDSHPPELRALDSTYCPVFRIVRDGETLLKIIGHPSLSKAECGETCECREGT